MLIYSTRNKNGKNRFITDLMLFVVIFVSLISVSLIGTYLFNFNWNNGLILVLFPLISLYVLLAAFDVIPERLFPYVIWAIALALLFSSSLISTGVTGIDLHHEYYLATLVKDTHRWDPTINDPYNGMLSVVMLAPIYSILTSLSLTWVFKIVYPALFSLVPLILYFVFKNQVGSKIAFLSTFFFIGVFTFFTEMVTVARQEIAEVFLAMLLLVIISPKLGSRKKALLLIVFGFSLIVSHYSVSYFFLFALLIVFVVQKNESFFNGISIKFKGDNLSTRANSSEITDSHNKTRAITPFFIATFAIILLSWYSYVANGAALWGIVNVVQKIRNNIFNFLNPVANQGLGIIVSEPSSPLQLISRVLTLLLQFFIFIGIVDLLRGKNRAKNGSFFNKDFGFLALAAFVVCVAGITVPYFASSLNVTRLYHITLFLLAPFSVIGGLSLIRFLMKGTSIALKKMKVPSKGGLLKIMSIILVLFFLFNSGFVYNVLNDHPSVGAFGANWILKNGDSLEKASFYASETPLQDVASAEWLGIYRNENIDIYSDTISMGNPLNAYALIPRERPWDVISNGTIIPKDSYIYMTVLNVQYGIIYSTGASNGYVFDIVGTSPSLPDSGDKVYSNGGSEVYISIMPTIFNCTPAS